MIVLDESARDGPEPPLPAVEVTELGKRYAGGGAQLVPIPWLRRRRGGRVEGGDDENAALAGDLGDDDDDDDDDDDRPESIQAQTRADTNGPVWALRDVTFQAAPGDFLGVVGETGSGKSTLVRVLTRVTPPTSGRAVIRGRLAPTLGMAGLFADRTRSGVDAIFLIARFFGVPRSVAEAAIEPIREFTELGPAIDQRARTYTPAQYQRLVYATSLFLDPDVLISDELLFVGDADFRARSLRELEVRGARGLAVVLATNDLRLVRRLCTDLLWLRSGRVEAIGTVDEVAPRYEAAVASKAARRAQATAEETAVPSQPAEDASVAVKTAGIYAMEGDPVELLQTSDDALVELSFAVREPGRMRAVVALFRDGEQVMRLAPQDFFEIESPGVYAATVHVPGGTLPSGSFESRVAILGREAGGRKTLARTSFRFEVLGGADQGGDTDEPRVWPRRLLWELTRLGDVDSLGRMERPGGPGAR